MGLFTGLYTPYRVFEVFCEVYIGLFGGLSKAIQIGFLGARLDEYSPLVGKSLGDVLSLSLSLE